MTIEQKSSRPGAADLKFLKLVSELRTSQAGHWRETAAVRPRWARDRAQDDRDVHRPCWAERWFANRIKPVWLVCRRTPAGSRAPETAGPRHRCGSANVRTGKVNPALTKRMF